MDIPQPTVRPEDAAPLQLDAQGALAEDIPCRKCAYNLRGLSPEGRCPECGTPVGLSTHGDLLRFADPAWIATVARGITILLWMILVSILVSCAANSSLIGPAFGGLIGLALQLVNVYGAWLLTAPDPSGIGEDPTITARKVIRFTLIVGIGSQVIMLLTPVLPQQQNLFVVLAVLGVVVNIIWLVGEFAKFVYYAYLARRIPDPKLAGSARLIKWGYVVCLGVPLIGGVIFALVISLGGSAVTPPATFGALACLMVPAGLGLLVFGIMTIFLLIRLRRALREQAEKARLLWASAGVSLSDTP